MNTRNLLRYSLLAAAVLVLSCQDQKSPVAPEAGSASVAFRLAADNGPVPAVDIVQIDVDVFRDSAYQSFDQRRFAWNDSAASLQVPLHTPLRFRIQGLLRRDNREIVAWTATQFDTLHDLSVEANIVSFGLNLLNTDPPDVVRGLPSSGANLIVLDSANGKLELNIPSGDASGSVSFPTTLAESLYVNGSGVAPVDGAWKLELGLGSSSTIQLVGTNKAVASWTISVGSRDRLGLEFSLSVDNYAVRTNRADTSVFTLPYVVDSVPHLDIRLDVPRDRPRALTFNGKDLDTSRSSWSIPLPVPEAGTEELRWTLESRDSVGNVATRPVVLRRSTEAQAPVLSWELDPALEPWGPHTAKYTLKIVGGDSLNRPACTSVDLGGVACGSAPLRVDADSAWWQVSIPLQERDSGAIVATVSNKLGSEWKKSFWIRRFDPAGPDTIGPQLTVTSPLGTGWIRSGNTSILTGTSKDERGGKVRVVVAHGGTETEATWNRTDNSWTCSFAWTSDGDSLVQVRAVDSSGNEGTPVPVRLVRDTRLPTLAWGSSLPVSGDTLRTLARNVGFSVIATDAFLRTVVATRNGSTDTLTLGNIGGGEWFRRIELPAGWSTWTFAALDSAGNRQERSLKVLAGDTTGVSLSISVNNGASFRRAGDTLVYILPYVLDSAPQVLVSVEPATDTPSSLSWGGRALSVADPTTWTIPLEVPVAGPAGATTVAVAARDSLQNLSRALVRIVRDTVVRVPSIYWDLPPADKPEGPTLDTFVVLIVGGDSLLAPTFESDEFAAAISAPQKIATRGDSTWWRGVVSLGQDDSGEILVSVRNLLGRTWSAPVASIGRYNPILPDQAPPTFTLNPLPNAGWTRSNSVTLGGTAFDARSSTVQVWVRRAAGDSVAATWTSIDRSWSTQVTLATDVDTTLTVWAIDTAGNPSLPVPVRLRRDTRKPTFTWSTVPAISGDTLRTRNPIQTLSVNASGADLRRVWAVRATTVDTLTFASTVAGIWTTSAPLPQGWTTWTVGVSDSAGNDSLRVLRVLRDSIPPVVSWTLNGTIPEGKYAFSTGRDSLWISADTSVTLALSSTTGFIGVSVPAPSVDSAGTLVGSRSSLVLKPATGSTTTWTLTATDELGNSARPVKLVVVGLAAIASPVAKFGSAIVPAKTIDTLPWPQTAHLTCPSGTTLNIGTGTAKDSVIWTTTNLSLSCRGPKIRSNVAAYKWIIRDTASIALPSVPSIDSLLAVAVDENGVPLVFGNYGGYHRIHKFSTDTTAWSLAFNGWNDDVVQQVFRVAGFDASNKRYFGYYTSTNKIAWFQANDPSNRMLEIATAGEYLTGGNAIQGNAVRGNSFYQLTSDYDVTRNALKSPYALEQTYERSIAPIINTQKVQIALTKDSIMGLWLVRGGRGNALYVGSYSGSEARERFQIDVNYQRAAIAGNPHGNTFALTVVNAGKLSVFQYASNSTGSPSQSNVDAGTLPETGEPLNAEQGKSDLWINAAGTGVYRVESDVSQVRHWALPGVRKAVSLNQWDGAWSIVKVGTSYRLYHFKGSKQ